MKTKREDNDISRMYLVPHRIYRSIKNCITDENQLNVLQNLNEKENYIENAIEFYKRQSHRTNALTPNQENNELEGSRRRGNSFNESFQTVQDQEEEEMDKTMIAEAMPKNEEEFDRQINRTSSPLRLQQENILPQVYQQQQQPPVQPVHFSPIQTNLPQPLTEIAPTEPIHATQEPRQTTLPRRKITFQLQQIDDQVKILCPFCNRNSYYKFKFLIKHVENIHNYILNQKEKNSGRLALKIAKDKLKKETEEKTQSTMTLSPAESFTTLREFVEKDIDEKPTENEQVFHEPIVPLERVSSTPKPIQKEISKIISEGKRKRIDNLGLGKKRRKLLEGEDKRRKKLTSSYDDIKLTDLIPKVTLPKKLSEDEIKFWTAPRMSNEEISSQLAPLSKKLLATTKKKSSMNIERKKTNEKRKQTDSTEFMKKKMKESTKDMKPRVTLKKLSEKKLLKPLKVKVGRLNLQQFEKKGSSYVPTMDKKLIYMKPRVELKPVNIERIKTSEKRKRTDSIESMRKKMKESPQDMKLFKIKPRVTLRRLSEKKLLKPLKVKVGRLNLQQFEKKGSSYVPTMDKKLISMKPKVELKKLDERTLLKPLQVEIGKINVKPKTKPLQVEVGKINLEQYKKKGSSYIPAMDKKLISMKPKIELKKLSEKPLLKPLQVKIGKINLKQYAKKESSYIPTKDKKLLSMKPKLKLEKLNEKMLLKPLTVKVKKMNLRKNPFYRPYPKLSISRRLSEQ